MSFTEIRYEVADGVATVTLDRPHALNALTTTMLRELTEAIEQADTDDVVRVVIVTGAGRGQGAVEARMFGAEGAIVVLGDVIDDEGAAVAAEIGGASTYVHLDVSQEADWASAIATAQGLGPLKALVNNVTAGITWRMLTRTILKVW